MTACEDRMISLHALVDGEVDAVNCVAIESHLKTCAGCAAELSRLEVLRSTLSGSVARFAAPARLRQRIAANLAAASSIDRQATTFRRPVRGAWLAGGAFTAVAASFALLLAMPQLTTTAVEDQLVASHVRSLLANHLTDVATSDRHVVKPWFNGRIDFAPPVVELADQGFPLAGGRLDYIDGRVVPALVYHRRLHTINLFVRPAAVPTSPATVVTRRRGYSLARWTQRGLEYWAVSDIDPGELQLFQRSFQRATT